LWLHPEELPEQNPVGLDSHKSLTEVYEDRDVEDTIGIKIQVLDAVVPEKTFEEITSRECQSNSTNLANIGISSGFFSIGYESAAAARHISISFSRKNLLLTRESRSSVFNLAFFHSLVGLECGEDGGDNSRADPSASLRALFFPASVFELLDGDAFILQVQSFFTHIRSGATLVVDGGGAPGSLLSRGGSGSRSSAGED
jgi:hypothetical protein